MFSTWFQQMVGCGAVVAALSGLGAIASPLDSYMISEVQANRIGLSVQWSTQFEATNVNDLVAACLVIDENDATTFFEITGGRVREVISQRDILPSGRSFGPGSEGLAKAREYAEIRREILQHELSAQGLDETAVVREVTLPRSTVYLASRAGAVQALDAETGKLLWRAHVGHYQMTTVGMAANPRFVAVVVGSTVHCLDARTGKELWRQRCSHGVTGNPTFSEHYVFVPMWDGHLQAFPLDNQGRGYRYLTSRGAVLYPATLAGNDLGWSTDTGTFNVADVEDDLRLLFRLRIDSPVVGSPTYRFGHFFFASLNGHVYAVDQQRQKLKWSSGLGEIITAAPVVVDQHVYVFTRTGKLFKLSLTTGAIADGWENPPTNMYRFVGASQKHLFVLDDLGDLIKVDQESGSRLGAVGYQGSLKVLPNQLTDRLYICHPGGMIQCLREIANVSPVFHVDEPRNFDVRRPREGDSGDATDVEEEGPDPFQGLEDRFQRGNQNQPGDMGDPFRRGGDSGNDPFRRGG